MPYRALFYRRGLNAVGTLAIISALVSVRYVQPYHLAGKCLYRGSFSLDNDARVPPTLAKKSRIRRLEPKN